MRTMRKMERALPEAEARSLLERAEYGILSTVDRQGNPYGIPLNFCVIEGCIYFHCAPEGHKIDNMEEHDAVSLCVVGKTEIMPEKFSTRYESVVVVGRVEEVFAREKQMALEGLLHKYSANFLTKGKAYIERAGDKTRVYRIAINRITGKARR